jgi:hypothetical protein
MGNVMSFPFLLFVQRRKSPANWSNVRLVLFIAQTNVVEICPSEFALLCADFAQLFDCFFMFFTNQPNILMKAKP